MPQRFRGSKCFWYLRHAAKSFSRHQFVRLVAVGVMQDLDHHFCEAACILRARNLALHRASRLNGYACLSAPRTGRGVGAIASKVASGSSPEQDVFGPQP